MRDEIIRLIDTLNHDELEVVNDVVQGLVTGRKVYGPLVLSVDPRDFENERYAEIRDAIVYSAILSVQARHRRDNKS